MTQHLDLSCLRLPHGSDLALPEHATLGSAGLDLRAALGDDEILTLNPGDRKLIGTGLCIALPEGYEAQIRPRSGLAYKNGITVLNAPGTIDSDYRGEIKVLLINLGQEAFEVTRNMRIAQMVIASYTHITWDEKQSSASFQSLRGAGGFGSTGTDKLKKPSKTS